MNRHDTLSLLQSSLLAHRPDYVRQVAQAWLAQTPNDLAIKFLLAQAHQAEKDLADAQTLLTEIVTVDWEHAPAHHLLAALTNSPTAYAIACALDDQAFPAQLYPPHWFAPLRRAVQALHAKKFAAALTHAHEVLSYEDAPPLASLILLKSHWLAGQLELARPLAQGFHERWPQSVAIILCYADCLFNAHDAPLAVELLYNASALDAAGDIVRRYWHDQHKYRDLWQTEFDFTLPAPVPFEVTKLLGKNQLVGQQHPTKQAKQTWSPQPPLQEHKIEHTVALNTNQIKVNAARFHRRPVHVILFSGKLLKAKFGEAAAAEVIGLLEQLAAITGKQRRVPVHLIASDDPVRLTPFNLEPIDPTNAWAIKKMIHSVDRVLARKGQAINSLLLIGGDDLLPFHRLPNPTDDADADIPSDNPYGCSDDNYFVPEWAVGRLPSPCGRDAEPLKRLLRNTINAHVTSQNKSVWLDWMKNIWRVKSAPNFSAIGYAASVWKEAALEVFAPIGQPNQLHTSPPLETTNAPNTRKFDFSYFNLHGIEDGADWFGQRDPNDEEYGALYPVALKPTDLPVGNGLAPRLIFTEACYGANIIGKTEPDAALCLRFLNDGTRALIGSTKIAYGSVSAPLIGADLLGKNFWTMFLSGLSIGEALRRAKLDLAQTMHQKQNFLDGEDQKTLISFVLYGDPSLPSFAAGNGKTFKALPELKTMAMTYQTESDHDLKPEHLAEMKTFLARYLPGAESASINLSRPLSPITAKGNAAPTHRVYTIAKTFRANAHSVKSYARVTMNKSGKVVKLAVSK